MKKWLLMIALVDMAWSDAVTSSQIEEKPEKVQEESNPTSHKAAKDSRKKESVKNDAENAAKEAQNLREEAKNNTQDTEQKVSEQKASTATSKRELVNKIAVLIYVTAPSQPGSDKELEKVSDIVITLLDVERPSIDGRMRTLDELILDKLMAFEAVYFYRMVVSDEAIDKYINSIKEHYNISDDQLRAMFRQAGYTYEEGREQLGASQAIDSLLNFKIRSRLVVDEKEARAYYDAHPVYEEASYKIKKAFIPEGTLTEEELGALSDKSMKKSSIQWSSPYWLAQDEMTEERRAIIEAMEVDQYSKPEQVTGGYEVIKLLLAKPRALKSFEDRYREIAEKLQEPQYHKMFEAFKKELLSKYEIVYL